MSNATENYHARALEAELLIGVLQQALALHKEAQAGEQRNWGFSGDLAEVNQRLRDLVLFLGGDPDVADAAHGMSASVTASMIPVKP